MSFFPEPRSRRNLFDHAGHKVSSEDLKKLIVGKMCYLSAAYELMSDRHCLELWNDYFYGGSFFDEQKLC